MVMRMVLSICRASNGTYLPARVSIQAGIRKIPASRLTPVINRGIGAFPLARPVQATIIPAQGATPVSIRPTAKSG